MISGKQMQHLRPNDWALASQSVHIPHTSTWKLLKTGLMNFYRSVRRVVEWNETAKITKNSIVLFTNIKAIFICYQKWVMVRLGLGLGK